MKRMQNHQLFVSVIAILLFAAAAQGSTLDLTTKGNWLTAGPSGTQKYGASGYILNNYLAQPGDPNPRYSGYGPQYDLAQQPTFLASWSYGVPQPNLDGQPNPYTYVNSFATTDVHALEDPRQANPATDPRVSTFVSSYWYSFEVTLNISRAAKFELGLYGIGDGASQAHIVVTSSGGTDSANWLASPYSQGEWAIFTVTAAANSTVTIDFTTLNSLPASTYEYLSGITFDEVPEPSTVMLFGIGGGLLFHLRHGFGGQGWRRRSQPRRA